MRAEPQILEQLLVAHGIHALPEAFVAVRGELAVCRKALQDFGFEAAIGAWEAVEYLRLENQEATVDPTGIGLRLLAESGDERAVERQAAKAGRRTNGRYGGEAAAFFVKFHQSIQVNVGEAVAVSHKERPVGNFRSEAFHPSAGQGVSAGVDQMHGPIFRFAAVALEFAVGELERHVSAEPAAVEEVALDVFAAVTEGDNEFAVPVMPKVLEDVPENGPPADFDHGLGPYFGFLGQARAASSGEDDDLWRGDLRDSFDRFADVSWPHRGGRVRSGPFAHWCVVARSHDEREVQFPGHAFIVCVKIL